MEFGKVYNGIVKLMIYVVFLTTSYAALFPVSFLDDLAIVVIALLEVLYLAVGRENIKKDMSIIASLLLAQILWLLASMLSVGGSSAIESFFTFFKIIVIFMLPLLEELTNKDKMIKNMVLLSIPNIGYALYEFYTTYVCGIHLPGKYDSSGYYRLQGLTGHPIFFSLLLVVVLMYFLYISNSKLRFCLIPIYLVFAMLTWSELAQVGALLLIGYKAFESTKVKNIFVRYVAMIGTVLLVGLLAVIFLKMTTETYTIRYISVVQTLKNFNVYNLFFGSGFGAFVQNGLSESYIFHVLYDSGLIGLCLLGATFYYLYKVMLTHNNYAGIFILSLYLVSMFINEGYMVPFIAFVPVLCGVPIGDELKRKIYIVFD